MPTNRVKLSQLIHYLKISNHVWSTTVGARFDSPVKNIFRMKKALEILIQNNTLKSSCIVQDLMSHSPALDVASRAL